MATSFTVPCTDKQPMSPPGKNMGSTVKVSVLTATLPGRESTAPSFMRRSSGLSKCLKNSSLMSRWEALPPEP